MNFLYVLDYSIILIIIGLGCSTGEDNPVQHDYNPVTKAPPDPPYDVTILACTKHSAVITWTSMPDINSPIQKFHVEYNHSLSPDVWTRAATVSNELVNEVNVELRPFASYNFRVIAENVIGQSEASVPSASVCKTESQVPDKNPSNVRTDTSKPGWLIVKWDAMPEIEHNGPGFRYKLAVSKDEHITNIEVNDWRETTREIHTGFVNEPYLITVAAVNDVGECHVPPVEYLGYSGQGVPGPVKAVDIIERGADFLTLKWEAPEETNGDLIGYDIRYAKLGGTRVFQLEVDNVLNNQILLNNLDANQKYWVNVSAKTRQGRGEAFQIESQTLPVHDATKKTKKSTPATTPTPRATGSSVPYMYETTSSVPYMYKTTSSVPYMYNKIRLPYTLLPSLYNITIQPFVYGDNPKDFTFACEVVIDLDCIESTDYILIHSMDHNISYISITNKTGTTELVDWWYIEDIEMVQIRSLYTLTAGVHYTIYIRSVSRMSESLRGFYYSPYKEREQTKYIFTTMMEPTDARRVFPCFDEPDFKAVFIFNIKRKEELKSLTNLPKRLTVGPDNDGYYTDIFDEPRNVPMSTYLVAIAVGDLDYLESTVNNVTFRTWCRSKQTNKTRYALEIGMKFMEFFEDYFQIPYSLPKEDMIAVPTMSFSGMEHWGLITYRESKMFYEEGISSLDEKEGIAIIIAHEVAHQWFGNLVSPYWWDDLWLNEGFATYMMFLAVDRVLPSWNMVNKLIVEPRGVHNVMQMDDDTFTSHPVYVHVDNPDEINRIFDLISYAKGGSVIRMMNFFLGEDTFRKGLTRYLRKFSYKTATHNDLWSSLSEQAVIDKHTYTDVKAVMDTWVLEANYPVVNIARVNSSTIQLTQSAFLETEEQRVTRSHVIWKIPFVYTTDVENNFDKTFADITWISNKTAHVTDKKLENVDWIIGNIQQYGFYRVNYDDDNWNALLRQLRTDHTVIHPINRAQIINDAWNLARAGLLDMQIALKTLDYLDVEYDFVVWKSALRELEYMRSLLQLTAIYGHFERFMRERLEKTYFHAADAVDHYNRLQYSMVSKIACKIGLKACIDDAMDVFTAWMQDDNLSVDPDLKETVYCTGVEHGDEEAWNHVLSRYFASESTSETNFLLHALTCTQKPWLIMRLAEMLFHTDIFSKTEKVSVMIDLSDSPVGRLLAWHILEENWDTILKQYGDNINLISGIIFAAARPFNSRSEVNLVKSFIDRNTNVGGFKGEFLGVIDFVEGNIELMDTHYDTIKAWLTAELN
ncbi:aminopeptidase Ey-like isoform X2 [Ruditapes philippinarum]|uniref:aminopeptidase Ey-like isoform X2 n=1 Tax=Ruditapes philippinarum TaxID=129788 RepID=UPI00295BAF1A|nr:aminopeptidase Ey-like isoform X2 [Ruditapes philippinarum]